MSRKTPLLTHTTSASHLGLAAQVTRHDDATLALQSGISQSCVERVGRPLVPMHRNG